MKVLALNGSPRGPRSCTNRLLTPLLEGMQQAGAETELIHLSKLDIKHCVGCFYCWSGETGNCVHDDDMTEVLASYLTSDLVIFGTPLYHYHMTSILKTFIDRTLPAYEPLVTEKKDNGALSTQKSRFEKPSAVMLVSPCGFPEFEQFNPLTTWLRDLAAKMNWNYAGEILRPSGEVLTRDELQDQLAPYFERVREAGRCLVKDGHIPEELVQKLKEDILPGGVDTFRQKSQEFWMEMRVMRKA